MKQLLTIVWCLLVFHVQAQDDLMDLLAESTEDVPTEVTSTFKGMRLISGHTARTLSHGTMDFVISHRFGRLNSGAVNFFGVDNGQIRLGLELGVTERFTAGLGRSSNQKVLDGFLKYKLLAQKTSGMPITLTAFTSMAVRTGPGAIIDHPEIDPDFAQRTHYSFQLLIASKISPSLSLQVAPSLVHRNVVETPEHPNDILAIGLGGRIKLSNRVSLNAEYYPQVTDKMEFTDALSFGFDIETGGHVFQLHVTNSRAMIEEGFIGGTTGEWTNGDIHFGFNVARSFKVGKEK